MRLKSLFSILAGAALIFSACSPEEYEMGAKTYVSDDLVEGIAYTAVSYTHLDVYKRQTGC